MTVEFGCFEKEKDNIINKLILKGERILVLRLFVEIGVMAFRRRQLWYILWQNLMTNESP